MVVYDRAHHVCSVLFQVLNDSCEEDFLYQLAAAEEATPIPTLSHLLALGRERSLCDEEFCDIMATTIDIRKSLNINPFRSQEEREQEENYTDLAKTTVELTKIIQRLEETRLNVQVFQGFATAASEMHTEYYSATPGRHLQNLMPYWTEVQGRLHFISARLQTQQSEMEG